MVNIDPQLVAILAIAGLALGLVLAVVVALLGLRLRAVRRTQRRVFGRNEVDVIDLLDRHGERLAGLGEEAEDLRAQTGQLHEQLRGAVSRVAIVRYDAFENTGGGLSFSAAMLDDHGHGVVISAINGRAETRCYAKEIIGGRSHQSLTDEEHRVIDAAVGDHEITPAPVPETAGGRRRRRRAS